MRVRVSLRAWRRVCLEVADEHVARVDELRKVDEGALVPVDQVEHELEGRLVRARLHLADQRLKLDEAQPATREANTGPLALGAHATKESRDAPMPDRRAWLLVHSLRVRLICTHASLCPCGSGK
eukprot:6181751-Pleurochrysis_carterae.AAC.1